LANLALPEIRALDPHDCVVVINRPADFNPTDPDKDGDFALVDPTTLPGSGDGIGTFDVLSGGAPATVYDDVYIFSGGNP